MTTVAINGFGRIGRSVLRALHESGADDLEIVAVNDLAAPETLAHALQFDSVHGRFPGQVGLSDSGLDFGRGPIRMSAERNPEDLDWADVDIALDCTGIFKTDEGAARHMAAGAGKVLISAPAKGSMKTIVYGVNHGDITSDDTVVSNGSCTTNCLAPVAHVLHEAYGIKRGTMTTVHAYTGDQPTLDTMHKDLYRARAAALSMIPTSTGAAKAVGLVLPELAGKLDGSAIRVPTPNVSVVDLKCILQNPATADDVNGAMKAAADGALNGILACEEAPLVSSDLNHDAHSSIFAAPQTKVMEGGMVRVMSWYDNEWGFSNRMLDTARHMATL